VFNLNIVPSLGIACRLGSFDFVDTIIGSTLIPIIFSACIMLFSIYQKATARRPKPSLQNRQTYGMPADLMCEYTREETNAIILAFVFLDTDGGGGISREKVEHALNALGLSASDDRINAIFAEAKTEALSYDDAGDFTFDEFMHAIDRARHEGLESEFTEMVDMADERVFQGRTVSMVYVFLVFSFIVLVGTSSDIFAYFKCQTFFEVQPNESYLELDYGVDCNGARYKKYRPYVLLMLLVYPVG
jgi:hypothetical protein